MFRLDHSERTCNYAFKMKQEKGQVIREYGPWLRAEFSRSSFEHDESFSSIFRSANRYLGGQSESSSSAAGQKHEVTVRPRITPRIRETRADLAMNQNTSGNHGRNLLLLQNSN